MFDKKTIAAKLTTQAAKEEFHLLYGGGETVAAEQAVLAGADIVLELPTIFALAPAELFAKGAVRILSSLPPFSSLVNR